MRVRRGYKTELDLTNHQVTLCKKHAGVARWAYNWGLCRRQEVYQAEGRSIWSMELHRELNVLKQTEVPWMYEVSKAASQEALRDLDNAFRHFFRRCQLKKEGKWKGKRGYPQFKTKRTGLGSFRLTGSIHVYEAAVELPRLGRMRLKERGYLPTSGVKILSATVSEGAGRWFVSVQVEEEVPDPIAATGDPIGVDTGSKNRVKARKRLARKYARVRHVRHDALHKATSRLTRARLSPEERSERQQQIVATLPAPKAKVKPRRGVRPEIAKTMEVPPLPEWVAEQVKKKHLKRLLRHTTEADRHLRPRVVVLEDLNVEGMKRNRKVALAISDVGLGEFRRQMTYKSVWQGETLHIADRWFPSTKKCSACGNVKDDMDLSERIYVCDNSACGLIMDRDLNAARNLVALAN